MNINVNNKTIGAVLVVVVLLAMTAGASALITRNNLEDQGASTVTTEKTVTTAKPVHHASNIKWNNNRAVSNNRHARLKPALTEMLLAQF